MQLTLRAQQPALADAQVRKAILGLLDVDLLAAVGAGSDNTVTLAQAQVRSPSDPGYVPTAPPAMTREAALGLLADAGYSSSRCADAAPAPPHAEPPDDDRGRITKDGQPLTLVLGVAANDPTSVAVANTAADQLRNVGIAASVSALDPPALYGDALAKNRVDAIVGWHQAGGDLATALGVALRLPRARGDGRRDGTPGSADRRPRHHRDHHDPSSPRHRHATIEHDHDRRLRPAPESGQLVQAPSNLTGICDRSIQPKIDAALDGTEDIAEVLDGGRAATVEHVRPCCRSCRTPRSSPRGPACRT